MKTFFLSQINAQNQMSFELELFRESNACGDIVLLLYSWNGPVISIGKSQSDVNINRKKCEDDGVKVAKRLTGGRAVFHLNDISYSISIPKNLVETAGRNLRETVVSLSKPIRKTFADFGIAVDNHKSENADLPRSSVFCAQTRSFGEISVGGKKICASSQIFTTDGILQHGTIPITDDYLRICDYFDDGDAKAKEILRRSSTCLNEVRPELAVEEFMRGLARNFEECLS